MSRAAAIILGLFSLPGAGIGSLGREAYNFIDFLQQAGQSYWQLLPLHPTGYGDSPYQALSAWAGNPYYIDLPQLAAEGWLDDAELAAAGDAGGPVDYGALFRQRWPLLWAAYHRIDATEQRAAQDFRDAEGQWLEEWALFIAAKQQFDNLPWEAWPDADLSQAEPQALAEWRERLAEPISFHCWLQYKFFSQLQALRAYGAQRGLGFIGDLPLYVATDSADLWLHRELFQVDEAGRPTAVAGVPPDYFSANGQLWGNPLYDWPVQAKDGYAWQLARLGHLSRFYDLLRLDHFRGLDSYWAIPAGAADAAAGEWRPGPGAPLIDAINSSLPQLGIIAEDLGMLTPSVHQLLEHSGWPGMKVLQFAFDQDGDSPYQPHNYAPNCVCYSGTHDNPSLAAWRGQHPWSAARATAYFGLNQQEGYDWGLLRGGHSSTARLFAAQMQDYLGLGVEARINCPGQAEGNWAWRLPTERLTPELAERIRSLTRRYGR